MKTQAQPRRMWTTNLGGRFVSRAQVTTALATAIRERLGNGHDLKSVTAPDGTRHAVRILIDLVPR